MVRDDSGAASGNRKPLDMAAVRAKIAGAVDRAMHKKVAVINRAARIADEIMDHDPIPVPKPMTKNRTGFGGLGSSLKVLEELKAVADDFNKQMADVKTEGEIVAADAKQIADQAKREIAEARNYLAQFGNGGPD